MNKGLRVRTGQTHVNRWTDDLLHRILDDQIDRPLSSPTRSISIKDLKCTRRSATSRTAVSK